MDITTEQKAKVLDDLMPLLKQVFKGNGNINFDGTILNKIAHIVNSDDQWNYDATKSTLE